MARKTRIDYNNIFDNGIDDLSDLVNQFTKKNKRVHRIFGDDDDDVQVNNDQSYGLRLISVHENEASVSTPDKENGNKQVRRSSITNVRPLSPVQIVEAPPEQISESRSPFKHPSQLTNRQNASLRRSLFKPQKTQNNDLICSTPSTRNNNNNQGISNDFFGSSSSRIEGLSPIRKGLSDTIITVEDLRGIELIEPENNKNGQNVSVVQSLQGLEKDLREQFQIEQGTPKKTYSKSLAGEPSRRSFSETKNAPSPSRRSLRSEPISLSQPTKNCSVIVEPMEISKDTISMYRKSQLSRLSTSNLTNVNTFNMIETPIARQTKHSIINDSLLAKKLALCESDSEITDDESEKSRNSNKQNKSKKQKTVENEAILTNDESDKIVESPKRRKISQNIEITPKKVPSRRPSRQSAPKRLVDPLEVQNDEFEHEEQQFELVIDENPPIISQQILKTPKKIPSRRPSKDVAAASQKSKKDTQEVPKTAASSQKLKKSIREAQNITSDESDEDIPAKKDKNRNKNSQQVVESPQKLPSRRPSKDVVAESQKAKKNNTEAPKSTTASQKSKKIDQAAVDDSSDENDDECPPKQDKNHKKNAVEPKKKATEKKKSVHVTETSQDMEFSESEPEEPTSTKKSTQMSISDNIRIARKSTKSAEQMNMSVSESEDEESTQQDTRKSTQNSDQMSMSEDEPRLVIDLKENRKSKGNKKRQQSPIVDDPMSDGELTDKLPEPEESEEESPPKVQKPAKKQTAEKVDKKSQKGSKKSQMEICETQSSETVYSDMSLSNYKSPLLSVPPKAKKPTSKVKEKVPDPPKSKKNAKSKKIESEDSESDEEPAVNVKKVPKPSKSKKTAKNKNSVSEESDSDQEPAQNVKKQQQQDPQKGKKNARQKESVSEESESDEEPRNQQKEQETEPIMQFKKPQLFKKSLRETISCNLSNVSAGSLVPTEIVESFRTLQKPGNNTTSIVPESSKLLKPKGSKNRTVNPNKEKIAEYLRLEKSVKHKKPKNDTTKSKKRTLFNQNSDDDEEAAANVNHENPEIDPIDHELSEELNNVRRSIDTMSNASSQPFNATIPTQNVNEDESEEERPKKKGNKQQVVDESDQEMEEVQAAPKRTRGRPKKNVNKQQTAITQEQSKKKEVQVTKQQVTATDESDEVSENDTRQKATKKSKKTTMSKELISLTRKPATKRQNNNRDDMEPPSKTQRRAAATNEDSNSETSKNTDEGFQSDECDEYDDVWYDPIERGCQRQGLRVRKFTKSKDGRYAIQYGVFTRNDSKATQLQQKYKIKESELHEPSLASFIQPANKLELIQTLIMERKLHKKINQPKKKEVVAKKKAEVEIINDGASTSRQAMETDSLASFATARTNETQSGIINKLLDNFSRVKDDNTNAINVVETATYAISQINKLEWHPIGAGVFYSSFKENSFDGFLRLVKGGYKKGAKTKLAVVKMTLLCGVVDIKINGTKIRIENLGFITITRGQSYRIENVSDETAIILMTRLDEEETIPNQTNSLS